ncbi:MAG: hypothetical protein LBG72_08060 [Spirochaetaceae bacterium]|jgi:hypothetical protein|nr:hypothetical protein [Spirochaetaceae bacterium]
MTATAIRRKLKGYIDAISDKNLETVRPILSYMAETSAASDPLIIETDLTDEEHALIEEGMREYERDPSSFTDWEDVKREAGLI